MYENIFEYCGFIIVGDIRNMCGSLLDYRNILPNKRCSFSAFYYSFGRYKENPTKGT